MNVNVKAARDIARAVVVNGVQTAPLSEATVKAVLDALRAKERERRARIEQTLRGAMLGPDDAFTLNHGIAIVVAPESGRAS